MSTDRVHPETRSGDPFVAADHHEAVEELLEAAWFAVRWFRERERHAPPDTEFGGEAKVEARLRRAVARMHRS